MREREDVTAFIERIVAGAQIASRAKRDDLRRELWTHFEETGISPDAVAGALRRFGAEAMVTESLRRVYRRDYICLYLAKIAASIIASLTAALLIEVLVNLRVEARAEGWRLAPAFSHTAVLAVGVVLALVTAWEVGRQPFSRSRAVAAGGAYAAVCGVVQLVFADRAGAFVTATVLVALGYVCSRIEPRPARLAVTFGAFAATVFGTHLLRSVALRPSRDLLSSAVLVAVWASTPLILSRVDHAFVQLFRDRKEGGLRGQS
jgi:hypothetical protein